MLYMYAAAESLKALSRVKQRWKREIKPEREKF